MKSPIHFKPYLKTVIWGGEAIAPFKGLADAPEKIGESWEISAVPGHESIVDRGEFAGQTLSELCRRYGAELLGSNVTKDGNTEFPLLVKIIDASRDLSVQVHPDDALAAQRGVGRGKTEMWHVVDTRPGARIHVGLNKRVTPDEFSRLVSEKQIMDIIASYESHPGDTFFIPAGRIHAIGAGNLLVEIQQSSDTTYRIYDYDRRDADGNPRELHVAQALDAIDYSVKDDYRSKPISHSDSETIAACAYFKVTRHESKTSVELGNDARSFMILTNIGPDTILEWEGGSEPLPRGDSLLLPASMSEARLRGPLTVLATTVG